MQTRKPHRIKPNESTRFPTRFLAFDCETLPERDASGLTRHQLRLGVAVYFDIANNSDKRSHRDDLRFTTAHELYEFIERHAKPSTRLIITSHNLAFDLIASGLIPELETYGWKMSFPICRHLRFIARARRGKATLQFLDTLNYLPTQLETLGESMGIPKMKMPNFSDDDSIWYTYCQNDVEIIVKFWQSLYSFFSENQLGTFASTTAGLAFKTYRHKFMHHDIYVHNNSVALGLERDAYFGGRCEAFQIGVLPKQPYYQLDVNSLYPSVMLAEKYPTRLLRHREHISLGELREQISTSFVIAEVAIETNRPCFPKRVNGKLVFPVGRFFTALAQPELIKALENNEIRAVLQVNYYQSDYIFADYVRYFFEKRVLFSEDGNLSFALFAKILLNSLYGKFGQRGYERREIDNPEGIDYGYQYYYDATRKQGIDVYYWGGRGICEREGGEGYNSFPAISAAVTSYGRVHLARLIDTACSDNVYYVDTDSVIVNQTGYDRLMSEIDATQLGKLKLERMGENVCIYGAKDYTFNEKIKRKGIRVNDIQISTNTFEQIRFGTMLEILRTGNLVGVPMQTTTKTLRRIYDKGVVTRDGTITPFVLSEF